MPKKQEYTEHKSKTKKWGKRGRGEGITLYLFSAAVQVPPSHDAISQDPPYQPDLSKIKIHGIT